MEIVEVLKFVPKSKCFETVSTLKAMSSGYVCGSEGSEWC